MDESLWGKAVKPLPRNPPPKLKGSPPKGQGRREEYERRLVQQAVKKRSV